MKPTRRTLLKGLAALPLAALPAAPLLAAGGVPARFVTDGRLLGGRALAAFARGQGRDVTDPRGEIVALFMGRKTGWLASGGAPIIGLTSYSDMVLMRDMARMAGRPMRYAAAWSRMAPPLFDRLDGAVARQLVTLLRTAAPARARGRASAFLWLV